jgi:heme exporter protein D
MPASTPSKVAAMNWQSAAEFFAMGGYGLYVWGAYVVTMLVMVIEPIAAARRHRRARIAARQEPRR